MSNTSNTPPNSPQDPPRGNGQDLPPPNSEPLTTESLERFRASGMNYTVASKEVLTTVKIMKPARDAFIRTHPDPTQEFITFVLENKDGDIPIDPAAFEAIRTRVPDFHKFAPCVSLRPYITSKNGIYLWALKRESPFSIGSNSYNTSAFTASDRTRAEWLRVSSDQSVGIYRTFEPEDHIPEPDWSRVPDIMQLLLLAVKTNVIDSVDHLLIRPLRGKS